MLAYTYTDMNATKYAKSTVNVRSIPDSAGEKLGGLSANDEVKITGQCNETGWYRIEYNGSVAYVSDSYLVDNKIETQAASSQSTASSQSGNSSGSSSTESTASTSSGNSSASANSTGYNDDNPPSYAYAYSFFTSRNAVPAFDTWINNGDGTFSYYEICCHCKGDTTGMSDEGLEEGVIREAEEREAILNANGYNGFTSTGGQRVIDGIDNYGNADQRGSALWKNGKKKRV